MTGTFIVFGPPACGKTRNRERIARHLTGDAARFVEVDEPSAHGRPVPGNVHLTNDLVSAERKLANAGITGAIIHSFESVKRELLL